MTWRQPDPWPFTQVYTVTSEFRAPLPSPYAHLIPRLRELYVHAGFPVELLADGCRIGVAESVVGRMLRVTPPTHWSWRRRDAAYSATRMIRKPLCGPELDERHILECIEWGLRQQRILLTECA